MKEWHAYFSSLMDNVKKDARPQFSILFPYQKEFSCCSSLTTTCWCLAVLDNPQAAATAVSCCLCYCATGMGFCQKTQPSSPAFCTAFSEASTKQHVYWTNYLCCVPPAWTGKERTTEIVGLGADRTPVSMTFQLLSCPGSFHLQPSRKTQTVLTLESNSYVCEYVGDPDLRRVGVFWVGTITFRPSTSHINSSLLGLVFKSLRRVSAKLPALPCVWTPYEAELAGASSFKENNSPVKVSPLVLDGVYFWTNSQKNSASAQKKSHQPILKDQPGALKRHLKLLVCQKSAPRKLVVELASLHPLSWPKSLHLLWARPLQPSSLWHRYHF